MTDPTQAGVWITQQMGAMWPVIKSLWWVFLLLAVAAVYVYITRMKKKYPLNTVVLERRGEDVWTKLDDTLGRVKENGIWVWKFRKSHDTLPPENYSYLTKCDKGAGCAYMIKYGPGQYKPIDVKDIFTDATKFRIIDQDDWNFKVIEFRATMERRKAMKDFLQTWGPMIGLAVVCVTIIVTLYFSYQMFQDVAAKAASTCNAYMAAQPTTPAKTVTAGDIPLIGSMLGPQS